MSTAVLGAGGLVLGVVVLRGPTDGAAVAGIFALMAGAAIAAWVGAERAPQGQRRVGRLIAGGVSLSALGDILWAVLDWRGAATDASIADVPWFASYVFLCAALWIVLRGSQAGYGDGVAFVIDAATIVVVSVLVFWSFSIDAILADQDLATHVRIVWAAYPVADAVLLALVARVLMSRATRSALDASLAAGVGLWLAADIAYLQGVEGAVLVVADAAYLVAPLLLARAAWRVRSIAPAPPEPGPPGGWRASLLIAIGPLFVPPALEVVADVRGQPNQPVQLVVGSLVVIAIAFVRTARLILSEERAHRDLEVARDAALEASRAKSMFLATMSHEIRTPLTAVLGTGEMLEDTPLTDLQSDLVRRMRRSGDLLRSLVEAILDFSRIEAGQLRLTATRFDLPDLVDDLVDVYQPRATETGVRIECRVNPTVPRTAVGDRGRLVQVLSNLLDNALKFTHEGRVRLDVRLPRADAGRDVEFVVADTGIGIRPEDLPSVFDSFHQVDGSTTRRYGGSGLGLAICKELTELMGGSLTVTSEPGAGSVFVARFPLAGPVHPSLSA